jgi:hypothetical protein
MGNRVVSTHSCGYEIAPNTKPAKSPKMPFNDSFPRLQLTPTRKQLSDRPYRTPEPIIKSLWPSFYFSLPQIILAVLFMHRDNRLGSQGEEFSSSGCCWGRGSEVCAQVSLCNVGIFFQAEVPNQPCNPSDYDVGQWDDIRFARDEVVGTLWVCIRKCV